MIKDEPLPDTEAMDYLKRRAERCTTHHHACDCREFELHQLRIEVRELRESARKAVVQALKEINATAEADMLRGNPITGAHHRAIEAKLRELSGEV